MGRQGRFTGIRIEEQDRGTEWQPEETLALAVIQQAVWDWEKGREGKIANKAGNQYPLTRDVEDAEDFLRVRLWQRDNVWGQVILPFVSRVGAKRQMGARMDDTYQGRAIRRKSLIKPERAHRRARELAAVGEYE